jgi:tetratricopeptide (TPR) repeat protein
MFSQYELALEDHNRAVALARTKDSKAGTYLSRGVTRRFAGNVEGAIEDLSHAASLAPRFAQQYHCFIWEIRMLRGDPGDRVAAEAALEAAYDATTDAFDRKLVEACRGRVTADEMLSTATSDVMRCVAFYYLGARALVEDRRADAKNFFQNCRNTGVHDHAEYDLARWHLERLGNE